MQNPFVDQRIKLYFIFMLTGFFLSSCGPDRRDDLQDSGKVNQTDSTTNAKEAEKGVGMGGKGYTEEGEHDVVSGTDTTDTGNIPAKDSSTPK